MNTDYKYQLTVISPEILWPESNHLAACIGEGEDGDLESFVSPLLQLGDIPLAVVCPNITQTLHDAVLAAALGTYEVEVPEWDAGDVVDVEAAQGVLDDALIITEFDPENVPEYAGDRLLVVLGADWRAVASAFQLEPIEAPALEG